MPQAVRAQSVPEETLAHSEQGWDMIMPKKTCLTFILPNSTLHSCTLRNTHHINVNITLTNSFLFESAHFYSQHSILLQCRTANINEVCIQLKNPRCFNINFKRKNLYLFSISTVKIKYFQSCRARTNLWLLDISSYPYWDRYDEEH